MQNFDGNACLGLLPDVKSALTNFDYSYANPSGVHQLGQRARALVEDARGDLSKLLNINSNQRIIFTSGATESNNLALFYPYYRAKFFASELPNYLSTAIEHPAVLETLVKLKKLGSSVTLEKPQRFKIETSELIKHDLSSIDLLSVMFANNETGAINDIQEIFRQAKKANSQILTHTDAVQAIAKLPFDASGLSTDFISISGHKIGALTGIGALVVNDDLEAFSHNSGGPQEMSWRAGTENLPGIYSLGIAAKYWLKQGIAYRKQLLELKQITLRRFKEILPEASLNQTSNDLDNTLNITIPGIVADDLVVAMDLAGFAISSGSACASGKPSPSHVLLAAGLSDVEARSTIRISFSLDNKVEECMLLLDKIAEYVRNK